MGKLIFVTGGARSGKSRFAEELLTEIDRPLYIATAIPFDDEMKERIKIHRERRDDRWVTAEQYRGLGQVVDRYGETCGGILLDCITVMVTNLMLEDACREWEGINQDEIDAIEEEINYEVDELIGAVRRFEGTAVIVSNEVGMGIVPANPLSRHFRDIAGRVNQKIAFSADEVYFTVSGIPVKIKG